MLNGVVNPVSRFLSWWGRELADLVPGSLRRGAASRGARTVISADRSEIRIIEERGRSSRVLATAEASAADPLAVLDTLAIRGPIGLRVPLQACFSRALQIPASAVRDAAALAALDLERTTPLRSADVMSAVVRATTVVPESGKVALRQLVVKRETVRPLVAALAARGLEADFIDCWGDDGSTALPIDFLAAERAAARPPPGSRRRLQGVLAAAAAAGIVASLAIVMVKHANALAVLDLDVEAARRSASVVGQQLSRAEAALADAERLRGLRARRPSVVALVDEVTRLLPDGAYLTELTLEGDQLDLAGLAASAAPLLEIFEKSPLFADARFSAPFRLDAREDRERFAMRVRLRTAAGGTGAADVGGRSRGQP